MSPNTDDIQSPPTIRSHSQSGSRDGGKLIPGLCLESASRFSLLLCVKMRHSLSGLVVHLFGLCLSLPSPLALHSFPSRGIESQDVWVQKEAKGPVGMFGGINVSRLTVEFVEHQGASSGVSMQIPHRPSATRDLVIWKK